LARSGATLLAGNRRVDSNDRDRTNFRVRDVGSDDDGDDDGDDGFTGDSSYRCNIVFGCGYKRSSLS
jgi:hypothetical protein